MSIDQEIQIEDHSEDKKYFTQIPNIIFMMGLGAYIPTYYAILKSLCRSGKPCFMSQKKLASLVGCSDRQIQLMNSHMSKPFKILNGKPLIKIINRKNESGGNLTNLIQIVDIWVENTLAISKNEEIPQTPMPLKERLCGESDSGGGERASPGGEPASHNKEVTYKEVRNKESSSSCLVPKEPPKKIDDDDDLKVNSFFEDSKQVEVTKTNGSKISMTQSEIYRYFSRKPEYTTDMIKEAIQKIRIVTGPINDIIKYLEATCLSILKGSQNRLSYAKKELRPNETWGPIEKKPLISMGELMKQMEIEEKNKRLGDKK